MEIVKLKNIIEGALLAAGEPLSRERLLQLFEENAQPEVELIDEAISALQQECDGRAVELKEVASGFRYQVRSDVGEWVSRLWAEKPQRYSRALLETLALIAYRQPITRGEIEEIRGVAVSTQIIKTLQEREWVRIVGHRDVPGRPAMFATTRGFLDYFNMKSLEELPSLQEIRDLDKINQELDLGVAAEALANAVDDVADDVATTATAWLEPENEMDPADLLADDEVDAVLAAVESHFRKPSREEAQAAEAQQRDELEQAIADSDTEERIAAVADVLEGESPYADEERADDEPPAGESDDDKDIVH